jgi:electron-transferring-flavoprotein dehydrogenase
VDPGSLTELLGDDWISDAGAAAGVPVTRDRFYYLTGGGSKLRLPTPPPMKSKKCGARVVSLSELVRHLAEKAEAAGVDILPGFAAVDTVTDAAGAVVGVVTGDVGIGKDGKPRAGGVSPGVELRARATLIAEGCRGSLAERVMARYNLRADAQHQTYALGLKEVWSVEEGKHSPGEVWHTIGHPLDAATYGGGFVYHMGGDGNRVSVG